MSHEVWTETRMVCISSSFLRKIDIFYYESCSSSVVDITVVSSSFFLLLIIFLVYFGKDWFVEFNSVIDLRRIKLSFFQWYL